MNKVLALFTFLLVTIVLHAQKKDALLLPVKNDSVEHNTWPAVLPIVPIESSDTIFSITVINLIEKDFMQLHLKEDPRLISEVSFVQSLIRKKLHKVAIILTEKDTSNLGPLVIRSTFDLGGSFIIDFNLIKEEDLVERLSEKYHSKKNSVFLY